MLFRVENMTCGGCGRGVSKAVAMLDPLAEVSIDVPNRLVTVHSTNSREDIRSAIIGAGFTAEPLLINEAMER